MTTTLQVLSLADITSTATNDVQNLVSIDAENWQKSLTGTGGLYGKAPNKGAILWMSDLESLIQNNDFTEESLERVHKNLFSKTPYTGNMISISAHLVGACWLYEGNLDYTEKFCDWWNNR